MEAKTIRFIRRGEPVTLGNVPPDRTLLDLLREDLGATGTKEGCGEGDCGACTVVVGELDGDRLRYRAINSCIRLAHSIDGMALWTVEDLAADDGGLHPAQEAMVQCHGSQCGFCTPGFVMSLFGMYQNHVCQGGRVTRELAQVELSGNLCRCTGYRPILDAAQRMGELPRVTVDEGAIKAKLRALSPSPYPVRAEPVEAQSEQAPSVRPELVEGHSDHAPSVRPELVEGHSDHAPSVRPELVEGHSDHAPSVRPELVEGHSDHPELVEGHSRRASTSSARTAGAYLSPSCLADLLALRAAHPQAQLVAGCTDAGLWVTKMHKQFPQVLDVTRVAEMRRIDIEADHLSIGASVPLEDAFAAIASRRPQLRSFFSRFAGLPVRNSGTLGGNIANGSPIGDSMPLLIALGARIVLASLQGQRELPLEDFYTGYRQSLLAPDEVVMRILAPLPAPGEFLRAYKVSKRWDDDISAVCLVLNLQLEGGRVQSARMGAGGVAATPARARQAESVVMGRDWTEEAAHEAADALRQEFNPISDMRASAAYRHEVLGNLVRRFWLESQGTTAVRLESLRHEELPA